LKTPIPQFYRQGHLYLEDAVPGWDNTGSIRTGGFHRTVGSAGPQAPRQSNPLSWGTRSKSSLARAGYAGKARQRCEAPPQQGSWRRELILDCKLLINIALMSLKIRFCYILCYIEYNFRLQKMRLIINRNVVPRGFSIESQRYNASSDA
jgi:hypothetical protein